MSKVIITVAPTGLAANRAQCPAIPYTPDEIAEEAYRSWQAGASVVHIHAREDDGVPTQRIEVYKAIKDKIQAKCDIVINFSTGTVGVPKEERIRHITELKPELGALNMGSMNYAKYSPKRKEFIFDFVFENKFETIGFFLRHMVESGVKPELECFDTGHVNNAVPFVDMGILKSPIQYSFIMGVLGGIAATPKNLAHQASQIDKSSTWEVIGISSDQWPMVQAALELGGNVRVGLEDNFYLEPGVMVKSNAELVEKAVKMTRATGREVATPAEARKILSLK
ncbi:MAG: 3-keto-5-aminohexanoate cleavage protein [Deltaproteobacteria bacterium]|nr:3-keto-5-aminohexanoate cleavage protein [Deltaproteobacteria bacterium]